MSITYAKEDFYKEGDKTRQNYNIHNILNFQINVIKQDRILKGLSSPFSFFEIKDEIKKPDIILNIGKFVPSNNDCYVVDHKYHIKANYFYCKDLKGRVIWEVEIFGFEDGKTIINFDSKFLGPEVFFFPKSFLAQEMVLRPVITYKLIQKGYFLIHAGGINYNSSAYIFAGRGGSNKTAIILDFIKSGFDYLGDDWVILGSDKVLCFPLHLGQFSFSAKTGRFPTESDSNFSDKIHYYLWRSTDYNNVPIVQSSSLKTLFLLSKTNSPNEAIHIKTLNPKEATKRLISNSMAEEMVGVTIMGRNFNNFHNYMLAYSFIFPDSHIATYWEKLEVGLSAILEKASVYELKVPKVYNESIFNQIKKVMSVLA
jgi:hypothetical protein